MATLIVSNGASTPSGDKRWRWETRDDRSGQLTAAGPWCTSPVAAMPARARVAAAIARPDPMRDQTRRRTPPSQPVDDVELDQPIDVHHAAADLR